MGSKQKRSSQSASPSITFGSMPFDVEQTTSSFTDPGELVKQLAEELAISHEEATARFTRFSTSASAVHLMRMAADVRTHAEEVLASERVQLQPT